MSKQQENIKPVGVNFNGDKIVKKKLKFKTEELKEQFFQSLGMQPIDYIEMIVGKNRLEELEGDIHQRMKDALPEFEGCLFCAGKSEDNEDKMCKPYRLQMEMTYIMAAQEFMNTIIANNHVFKEAQHKKDLVEMFYQSFVFQSGKGVLLFDVYSFVRNLLRKGFYALTEKFNNSPVLTSLSEVNNSLDSINTRIMERELSGRESSYFLNLQKKFYEDKQNSLKTRHYIEKEQNLINSVNQNSTTTSARPTRTDIAYYAYYLSSTKTKFLDCDFPSVQAWSELSTKFNKNAKNIQLKYNEIAFDEVKRLKNKKSIEYVKDFMLKEYPKAQELANNDLLRA